MIHQHTLDCNHRLQGPVVSDQTCSCTGAIQRVLHQPKGDVSTLHPDGTRSRLQWGEGSPAGRTGFLFTIQIPNHEAAE